MHLAFGRHIDDHVMAENRLAGKAAAFGEAAFFGIAVFDDRPVTLSAEDWIPCLAKSPSPTTT